jgi:predicted lactoylglutathione lyase
VVCAGLPEQLDLVGDVSQAQAFYEALGWHLDGGVDDETAGATIARPGAATVWGGYSGVFVDPDGHPWEVAHNPGWTVHEDGRTTLD